MKSRPDVEPIINMVDAVLYLRQQRFRMVQSKEQYEFCYLAFNAKVQHILNSIKRVPNPNKDQLISPNSTKDQLISPPPETQLKRARPTTRKIDPKRASVIYEKVDISQESTTE